MVHCLLPKVDNFCGDALQIQDDCIDLITQREFAFKLQLFAEAKDFLFFFFCARVGLQMCHLVLFSACLALFDQRRRTGHSSGSARRGPGARDTAT